MTDSTAVEDAVEEAVEEEVMDTEEEAQAEEAEGVDDSGDEEEAEQAEGEDAEDEPEEIEFTFGNEKVAFSKTATVADVAEKLQQFSSGTWADYTRKSQEVAEQMKAVEAERQSVHKLQSMNSEMLNDYANGLALAQEIERYQKALAPDENGVELWQKNPDEARRISDAITRMQSQFQQSVQRVDANERAIQQQQHESYQKRLEEGRKAVLKAVPDFEQHAPAVVEYAVKNYGVSKESAEQWAANPVAAIAMFKAKQWDELQAKAVKTTKKQPAPAKPMAPSQAKKGKGGAARKDPGSMTPDEYEAWYRNKHRGGG